MNHRKDCFCPHCKPGITGEDILAETFAFYAEEIVRDFHRNDNAEQIKQDRLARKLKKANGSKKEENS